MVRGKKQHKIDISRHKAPSTLSGKLTRRSPFDGRLLAALNTSVSEGEALLSNLLGSEREGANVEDGEFRSEAVNILVTMQLRREQQVRREKTLRPTIWRPDEVEVQKPKAGSPESQSKMLLPQLRTLFTVERKPSPPPVAQESFSSAHRTVKKCDCSAPT